MTSPSRVLALVPLLLSGTAAAAESPGAASSSVSVLTPLGSLFQVLLALALVLGAIVATAWLLKRFGPSPLGPGGVMRVLGGVAVGPRERLVLVEVGETWLVVGVAPGQVTAVHSMPRPENPPVTPVAAADSSFAERLKQMLGGRKR